MYETRVLSGMRPTGRLHLGHYHGVLKNWVRLQAEYPCLFFVADWHALTTDYQKPGNVKDDGRDRVVGWLAAGLMSQPFHVGRAPALTAVTAQCHMSLAG